MPSASSLFITIVQSILPILVTLALGYYAAYRRDFDAVQASVLTRLVMLYALPIELLASILSTPRAEVMTAGPIAVLICFAMIGGYGLIFGVLHGIFRFPRREAAMIAMATTGPSVPFIGIPVLGQLFGPASAVPISVGALAMNLVQMPLSFILLQNTKPTTAASTKSPLIAQLKHAFREPVVWVPMLALTLVCVGFSLPPFLKGSLLLLGHTTGGAALFASGVVLFTRQVRFSPLVGLVIFAKNLVIPGLIYAIARMWHLPHMPMRETVLTMAIPSASINVILAMRFQVLEREVASILFFGTLSSIATMSFFIWLTS
ncbi:MULTISPECIES: AEC family transporter [Neokomagataea]|uniref:Transporter n=2 Tax=Neokomagataea TaxID=1223423 RepID=A0ABQ0QIR7_9PROT|nr:MULTISPECIES: AEC family transporter [Neokomagataea]MBR0560244.1 AEC family transporter [Neokomagataea anthophila]GBR46218.1 transporter [Neokomagataea tanensis NBRC 106556]